MSQKYTVKVPVVSKTSACGRNLITVGASDGSGRVYHPGLRDGGGGALIHKARGRTSNNRLIPGIREYVIELVRSRYADFGPSLAAEVLFEKDGVRVSRGTLRRWMVEDAL